MTLDKYAIIELVDCTIYKLSILFFPCVRVALDPDSYTKYYR